MFLNVASELSGIGLSAAVLVARNVVNTRTLPELIAYRRFAGRQLAAYWKNRSVSTHPCIREYHRVHEQFGAFDESPAPEKLITYVRRNRDFMAAEAVVDCYNIVSARTLLSIGAHDLDKLAAPITLRTTTPQDVFVPLGQTMPQRLPGEYAYVDPHGSIICRLDVLQCEQTKVTRESRDIVFFLQGNGFLPAATLLKGAWLLSEMVTVFCGGTVELVNFFAAPAASPPDLPPKPRVAFEAFKHLSLHKGTILGVKQLHNLPDLSAVTVRTTSEIQSLALSSPLATQAAGQEVIVATGLHPLATAGETFTACLPILQRGTSAALAQVTTDLPDGARLY
jgi:DNA/RNA-binding domain of Phe-tRNA-synthetase-like protein